MKRLFDDHAENNAERAERERRGRLGARAARQREAREDDGAADRVGEREERKHLLLGVIPRLDRHNHFFITLDPRKQALVPKIWVVSIATKGGREHFITEAQGAERL